MEGRWVGWWQCLQPSKLQPQPWWPSPTAFLHPASRAHRISSLAAPLASALPGPGPALREAPRSENPGGSKTALTWVSSAQDRPVCSPSADPGRTTEAPKHPASPQTATPGSGGVSVYLAERRDWALEEQGTCQSLNHRAQKRDGGAAAWSFRAWVLHCLAGALPSQPTPPRKQPGEVG